jgi:phospholipase C
MVRRPTVALAALALALALVTLVGVPSTAQGAQPAPRAKATATTSPCGFLSASYNPNNPPVYQHIVVLMEENLTYSTFEKSTAAPKTHALEHACGSEGFMHAATHPSQPNYMAATSGVATGVGVKTTNDNIFHQLQVAGGSWRDYAESMATPCQAASSSYYKPGHTPAFWYKDLRSPTNTCLLYDIPMSPALDNDITNDTLPSYAWITPDECDGYYWVAACSTPQSNRLARGDAYLGALMARLTAMPSYQAGQTLILITWDEGSSTSGTGIDCSSPSVYTTSPSCQIPTIVLSPYITPSVDMTDHNLYGLLATTEDLLGLPRLGRAVGAISLRSGLAF